jgi:hypothetical protein
MKTDTPPNTEITPIRSVAAQPTSPSPSVDGPYYLANAGYLDRETVEAIQRALYPAMLERTWPPSPARSQRPTALRSLTRHGCLIKWNPRGRKRGEER